ncbi:MAG: hypothetical protein PHP69_06905 [Candidatus Omnitrophica bacterium]|jgi:hypothetical protein|nr:hypothetical protein [Candidatus Omnitrophota bacterium]MDD5081683.1 hypothetical protein [Candidatus Omnitrophota bacterium]MDD5441468.1 hypothetical protein [Candidatus Omnitrophota bacterium]
MKKNYNFIFIGLIVLFFIFSVRMYLKITESARQNKVLSDMVARLEKDSTLAQVLVTNVRFNEITGKNETTIKLVELDSMGVKLTPRYFTFPGNILQFQSLVVRFGDKYIKRGDSLRGKSISFLWKVFMLDGNKTREYEINQIYDVPGGFRVGRNVGAYERRIWKKFWEYALDINKDGIKNAQIEAPGKIFLPGMLYILKLEHDGGIRIDAEPLPEILRGEKIL